MKEDYEGERLYSLIDIQEVAVERPRTGYYFFTPAPIKNNQEMSLFELFDEDCKRFFKGGK